MYGQFAAWLFCADIGRQDVSESVIKEPKMEEINIEVSEGGVSVARKGLVKEGLKGGVGDRRTRKNKNQGSLGLKNLPCRCRCRCCILYAFVTV